MAVSLGFGETDARDIKLDRRKDEENNKLLDYINFCQKKKARKQSSIKEPTSAPIRRCQITSPHSFI